MGSVARVGVNGEKKREGINLIDDKKVLIFCLSLLGSNIGFKEGLSSKRGNDEFHTRYPVITTSKQSLR